MRTRWAVVIAILMMGWTLSALAGPQIGIGDPSCPSIPSGFTQFLTIPPNAFTITPNINGGGYFGICNQTGTTWHTIDLFDSGSVQPQCYFIGTPTEFTSCAVNGSAGNFDIHLSGGTGLGSSCGEEDGPFHETELPSGCLLIINLNGTDPSTRGSTDPNGTGGFTAPLTGQVNAPEPTTMALLGSGLVGVWQYRRRRK